MASTIIGTIGAIMGGGLGFIASQFTDGDPNWLAFPTGITAGFIACFSLSIRYLKSMRHKRWQLGVFRGLLYSVLAAMIAAALTGSSIPLSHGDYSLAELSFYATLGACVFGIPAGVLAWIALTLAYIAFVRKPEQFSASDEDGC